jgi:hypothetical protein
MEPTADDRMKFVYLLGMFYIWAHDWAHMKGYRLSLGDAYRNPAYAAILHYYKPTSFHCKRCAQDINLFKQNGTLCENIEDYREMGEYWKSLDPMCVWGGDFSAHSKSPADADHFSYGEGK